MLPGFDAAKTEALARAVEALDQAEGRLSDLREAWCALEGLTDEEKRASLMGSIHVLANCESSAALEELDEEAFAAFVQAAAIEVPTGDALHAFARTFTDQDVHALELVKKTRARLKP